jgi:hypothetical protein
MGTGTKQEISATIRYATVLNYLCSAVSRALYIVVKQQCFTAERMLSLCFIDEGLVYDCCERSAKDLCRPCKTPVIARRRDEPSPCRQETAVCDWVLAISETLGE